MGYEAQATRIAPFPGKPGRVSVSGMQREQDGTFTIYSSSKEELLQLIARAEERGIDFIGKTEVKEAVNGKKTGRWVIRGGALDSMEAHVRCLRENGDDRLVGEIINPPVLGNGRLTAEGAGRTARSEVRLPGIELKGE